MGGTFPSCRSLPTVMPEAARSCSPSSENCIRATSAGETNGRTRASITSLEPWRRGWMPRRAGTGTPGKSFQNKGIGPSWPGLFKPPPYEGIRPRSGQAGVSQSRYAPSMPSSRYADAFGNLAVDRTLKMVRGELVPDLPADLHQLPVDALDQVVAGLSELAEMSGRARRRPKWLAGASPPPRSPRPQRITESEPVPRREADIPKAHPSTCNPSGTAGR